MVKGMLGLTPWPGHPGVKRVPASVPRGPRLAGSLLPSHGHDPRPVACSRSSALLPPPAPLPCRPWHPPQVRPLPPHLPPSRGAGRAPAAPVTLAQAATPELAAGTRKAAAATTSGRGPGACPLLSKSCRSASGRCATTATCLVALEAAAPPPPRNRGGHCLVGDAHPMAIVVGKEGIGPLPPVLPSANVGEAADWSNEGSRQNTRTATEQCLHTVCLMNCP
ncbi:hypothetical protein SORBI_3002G096201 [Sorghum bicolor]|uniref:Uncharacterized protein n=1 Tax=Sorghum bicolor TaxID=4558 RepID=A0A1W0W2Z4_SORBI|nr:hypothetical protein SORBI_3002G096201 [Sorghum bicolor]